MSINHDPNETILRSTVPAVDHPFSTREQSFQAGVELVEGSPVDSATEWNALLLRRLRQSSLLFMTAYLAYFLRDIFSFGLFSPWGVQAIALFVAFLIQACLAMLLWSGKLRGLTFLNAAEWATLLICWGLLGYTQFDHLTDWDVLAPFLEGQHNRDGQVYIGNTWFIAWFALIVGYPVLIPNHWQRALLVVGLTAIAPAVVTLVAMQVQRELRWDRVYLMFVQYSIWGVIAIAIAVYGTARTDSLRKQVSEARRFGQYILRHPLGKGGMGEVYLADHRLLKRPSVIKLIRPDQAHDPKMLARFEREVRILATLTHWNTVDIYDYGYTPDGTFYYVMEYLPGKNLEEIVSTTGPMPASRTIFLMTQVCHGLREAHAVGMIHRDIKPSNIMATCRGGLQDVAKLLDFGLVQADTASSSNIKLTQENAVLGTPHYMSPEQARGEKLDCRSDIYSLGVTLYYLITGGPPFDHTSLVEILAAHLILPPKPPVEINTRVPSDLQAVVLRCLAKLPEHRYSNVVELSEALAACSCSSEWNHDRALEWWTNQDSAPAESKTQ